jgi:hypothetical protein
LLFSGLAAAATITLVYARNTIILVSDALGSPWLEVACLKNTVNLANDVPVEVLQGRKDAPTI